MQSEYFQYKNPKFQILGFSIVEALFAGSLFAIIVSAFFGALIYGTETTQVSGGMARGVGVVEEGLEATRTIRDGGFANLTVGNHGLVVSGNQWVFSGTSDAVNIFTRQVAVALNPLGSGSRSITSSTTWQATQTRNGSLSAFSYLTNWRGCRGGMLVYGHGGTSSDAIRYRILKGNDASDCTWTTAASPADIDTGSTNRALQAAQVYASPTRDEKILVSRHRRTSNQYIYAQVYNGTTGAWGNLQLLSNLPNGNFLDVQNFSGTYLLNGDFMIVYSDDTSTPKFRTWNGTSWSSQISMQNIGGIPSFIVVRARPGTNEVMAAFFDQSRDANTQYFNGGSYTTGSWTLHSEHASDSSQANTRRLVDFAWSPNNLLKGGLVFTINNGDDIFSIKIWTADGAGAGSWSSSAATADQGADVDVVSIAGRPGADEFSLCRKDSSANIHCYKSDFTPTVSTPTNNSITSSTDGGFQKSFDIGFESVSGDPAINVYSDNTSTPKLKKYTALTSTWDSSAASLSALGGDLQTVRIIPYSGTDEAMVLMGNTNQDLYSVVWDGANNAVYTTPTGYAFSVHGTNGSEDRDFWFDFAWDAF